MMIVISYWHNCSTSISEQQQPVCYMLRLECCWGPRFSPELWFNKWSNLCSWGVESCECGSWSKCFDQVMLSRCKVTQECFFQFPFIKPVWCVFTWESVFPSTLISSSFESQWPLNNWPMVRECTPKCLPLLSSPSALHWSVHSLTTI